MAAGRWSGLSCTVMGFRREQGPDAAGALVVQGSLYRAHLRGRMPGGHVDHPVQGRRAGVAGLQPPFHLHQLLLPGLPRLGQQAQLGAGFAGKVGQGQGQVVDGRFRRLGLQPAADDKGGPFPAVDSFLEGNGFLPGSGPEDGAFQDNPAGVPAPYFRARVGPAQQSIRRHQQQFQGSGGKGEGSPLHHRFLVLDGYQGAVVVAVS